MNKISITPFTITKTNTITSVRINRIDIVLNTSATISYQLLNDLDQPVSGDFIRLEGEDYQNWGKDDTYIIDKIIAKYSS